MALEKVTTVSGRAVFIPGADIDTDRIIPARFMKCVTFDGLGEFAFYDVRFNPDTGEKTDHPLNDDRFSQASILLAGVNFGCGSSREHAPQSLAKYGFRAVIAESFAEIFFGNSTTLAMPCVTLSAGEIDQLRQAVEADPSVEISIDLVNKRVRSSTGLDFALNIAESARDALVAGRWDPIQELLDRESEIAAKAKELHYA
ncbi:MAG: 3-isopropylmalate dehydratase small subunit [Verrucomicrobia bacterium]|nr:MAG: 3-isopropylmalate dehydratase small subunit [Verrucomicrobiota bacterium]TAE88404.1 MAG: 3-isopropylmalate dehydratase small subunit [Verrucomicrobiota bacterium]TAF26857.1 MAG: 3-isopropylmalate dehydratase small subunit [Verrucomicrobiota bacterium]TAF42115.1 MAG: 3-isopropylmalate dehydratase small subunit [Verrucomicrobiota bacterium]